MERVYNFSAGPSVLPLPVLEQARKELVNYGDAGMSVMEMSHRSPAYDDIHNTAVALVRELMGVPQGYSVLFLQGGASTQFAMIPLNLMIKNGRADYIDTGSWSTKAIKEAQRYGTVNVIASSKDKTFNYIPEIPPVNPDADYCYMVSNNTIYGTRIAPDRLPVSGDVPLVADMSSNILSEVYDVDRFGVIFAGAQKNMGIAGVATVIIRDDLIGDAMECAPTMLRYKTHVDKNSLFNTPPCFAIYITKLVLTWVKEQGGIPGIQKINEHKAGLLYDYLDDTDFYQPTVAKKEDRSLMNVTFVPKDPELTKLFVTEAAAKGLVNLKGHRSVGGIRASIYNGMPVEGVETLLAFMQDFEVRNR